MRACETGCVTGYNYEHVTIRHVENTVMLNGNSLKPERFPGQARLEITWRGR
jgi:hypothetical protein